MTGIKLLFAKTSSHKKGLEVKVSSLELLSATLVRVEDGTRTSREELAGNKISEQKENQMAIFHKGPIPLRGVNFTLRPFFLRERNSDNLFAYTFHRTL
jgi:hypothetical protein